VTGDGLWLCAPPHEPSRAVTDRLLAEMGLEPVIRWEFEGLATIARLVAQGTGAALVPGLALIGVNTDPVTGAETRSLRKHRRIDAVIREGSRNSPAVVAVLDTLVKRGKEI
jgi:DNA-binding transcriptional LysR family regulator